MLTGNRIIGAVGLRWHQHDAIQSDAPCRQLFPEVAERLIVRHVQLQPDMTVAGQFIGRRFQLG
ncbi:hypothetical protein ACC717_36970, partial [Rhizobium ruizarguesonis]